MIAMSLQLSVVTPETETHTVTTYVTESTKTSLTANRQVLRKAGFNYLKCCSLPMAEATSIEFSHMQLLTLKTIL